MKNLITIMALAVMFTPVALADFVDYGTNSEGHQCFNELCNTVYSDDASLIMPEGSNTGQSVVIAQPNAPTNSERVARQDEVRRQICMILGCK